MDPHNHHHQWLPNSSNYASNYASPSSSNHNPANNNAPPSSRHASLQTLQHQFSNLNLSPSVNQTPRTNIRHPEFANQIQTYVPGSYYPPPAAGLGLGSTGFVSPSSSSRFTRVPDYYGYDYVHQLEQELQRQRREKLEFQSQLLKLQARQLLLNNNRGGGTGRVNTSATANSSSSLTHSWSRRTNVNNNNGNGGDSSVTSYRPLSWDEIKGRVVQLANDKSCHDYLLKEFLPRNRECVQLMVSEIVIGGVTNVVFNRNGSQFFQDLLDILSDHDVVQLYRAVTANQKVFQEICLDNNGTRAVQKIIDVIQLQKDNPEVQSIVVSSIKGIVATLMSHSNANHFVGKLVEKFHGVYKVIGPLLSEVLEHCVDLAMDKSGCCVLNKCIEFGHGLEREEIFRKIINHALDLSEHEFGNYVMQNVIKFGKESLSAPVVRELKGSFTYLAKNKSGSHVVEACLVYFDDEHVALIIGEITADNNVFLEIMQHPIGNYVAQTALKRSKVMHGSIRPPMFQFLMERIQANYAFLHGNMHGKKVLECAHKCKPRGYIS